jgi:hypothetical protein
VLVTSFKSFIGGCETLASGHARSACVGGACEARVGWHARSACVGAVSTRWACALVCTRWGDWTYALDMRVGWHALGARAKGTREARAFSDFNEHPLVNNF